MCLEQHCNKPQEQSLFLLVWFGVTWLFKMWGNAMWSRMCHLLLQAASFLILLTTPTFSIIWVMTFPIAPYQFFFNMQGMFLKHHIVLFCLLIRLLRDISTTLLSPVLPQNAFHNIKVRYKCRDLAIILCHKTGVFVSVHSFMRKMENRPRN